jgi:hypothetical protein
MPYAVGEDYPGLHRRPAAPDQPWQKGDFRKSRVSGSSSLLKIEHEKAGLLREKSPIAQEKRRNL